MNALADRPRIRLKRSIRVAVPPTAEPAPAVTGPATWLYVSRRLDLLSLPNVPLWAAPVITFGEIAYYRVTADVLAWLEAAGESLQSQVMGGKVERGQLDAYLAAMNVVWEFGYEWLEAGEVIRARAGGASGLPSLPDVYRPM